MSQDEWVARRVSFFPTLKATFNHIVTVDWLYIDALERAQAGREHEPDPGRFFSPEEPFETCAELTIAQRDTDRRLVALCVGMTEADLDRPVAILRRDGIKREPAARILSHLLQHQIHHRGQAHAMLAGTGVAPPQLDEFFLANEAHLRAADLAALGYTEPMIWD